MVGSMSGLRPASGRSNVISYMISSLLASTRAALGFLWCYSYSSGIRQVSCGMQPSNSIDSHIVKRCSCQVLEIRLWFLCDGRVIIFFGCKLHSWQLGTDIRISCGFLCVRLEEPLKFKVIFRYLVGPFVRFLLSLAGKVGCRHVKTRVEMTDMCLSGGRVADMSADMSVT